MKVLLDDLIFTYEKPSLKKKELFTCHNIRCRNISISENSIKIMSVEGDFLYYIL